jgi:hypothetical protein
MIVRVWSARATSENSLRYLKHFSHDVVPALHKVPGYLSSNVMTRPLKAQEGEAAHPAIIEIVVTTHWNSFESIDVFSGSDREASVVAPEAAALFLDYDHRVRHFEVAASDKQ